MTAAGTWLACLVAAPLGVVVASRTAVDTERLRGIAVAAALAMLAAGSAVLVLPPGVFGRGLLRVDALAVALVPLPAALWLLTVAVTPRSRLDRAALPRTALATLTTTLAFLTKSPLLLLALWTVSDALFLMALSDAEARRSRRVAGVYLATGTAILGAGLALAGGAAGGGRFERAGL